MVLPYSNKKATKTVCYHGLVSPSPSPTAIMKIIKLKPGLVVQGRNLNYSGLGFILPPPLQRIDAT